MIDNRFHGKKSSEYELVKLAMPSYDKLQNSIGKVIRSYFEKSDQSEIKVLEVGCGPGDTTFVILDSDERVNIIAVDNEPLMISQANKNLKESISSGRVSLIEEDVLKFLKSQKLNSFDVFASGFTLHNFTKGFRNKVLKEIYRVLKTGGIFVNADKYALDDEGKHKETLNWQLKQFKDKYSEVNRMDLMKEWTNHYLEDDRSEVIMKEGESIKEMKEIGFKNFDIVFRKQMEATLVAEK